MKFTPEPGEEICDRIAEGKSLRLVTRDAAMPGETTIYRWRRDPDREDSRQQYARALEAQADMLANAW